MNNIEDVTAELKGFIYPGLKNGTLDLKVAAEMNNTLGKVLSAEKIKLAYHALRGDKPSIPFLDAPKKLLSK